MINTEELKAIAAQLSHPEGGMGIEVATGMHANNIGMSMHSISRLQLENGERVLELGHGNGGHIAQLMERGTGLAYYGLEISELMHETAKRTNAEMIENGQAHFLLYDGHIIPFPENYFNKIFTVNTIYFWQDPAAFLLELYRILKPGGAMCITFAQESFMTKLPFTQYGFTIYNDEKIEALIATTPFRIVDTDTCTETITTKTGDIMDRDFTTVRLTKD